MRFTAILLKQRGQRLKRSGLVILESQQNISRPINNLSQNRRKELNIQRNL